MNGSDDWQLHVLGAFRLEQGSRETRVARRKVVALLVYLILHPDKHGREDLATLFWGDFPDREALHSLRTALSALRSLIDNEVVITDTESVRFNPTFPLWVDALAFQSYAARFLAEEPFDLAATFVDLYKGDLLPDFYDDWIAAERDRLRSLYIDVLLQATQQMRSRSEYERAIEFARRVLAIEPANERAHQHIMFCYITLGDRSAALKQYELCRQALQDDLGVEPMAETTALYHWVKGRPAHQQAKEALITNLPIPLSSFVGREEQMADVKRLLSQARLLTLAGPGGSGKTRLAIQVATDLVDAYKDGVWFIDLSTLQDAGQVGAAVSRTLRVAAAASAPTTDALVAFLRNRHALLVLDNCEHLVAACAQLVQDILPAAPQVKVLATSREILDVQGEAVYHVPALSAPAIDAIPPSLAALAGFEATRLFIERATATYPELSLSDRDSLALVAVCRQLDGMPLAIELAVARVKVLSVGEIAANMRERFTLLASGGRSRPSRQASLRAAIDWSYDLLPGDEQALLRRLSVFTGSFTLAGASAVGDQGDEASVLEHLGRLVDKSLLVVVQSDEGRRYRLLETIKLYGWDKLLEAGERDEVVRRHINFYCRFMEDAGDRYRREQPQVALRQASIEYDEVVAAIARCEETGDIAMGLKLFRHHELLIIPGGLPTLQSHLAALLAADASVPPALRGTGLVTACSLAYRLGDLDQAWRLGEEGLALCEISGDKEAIAYAKMHLGRSAQLTDKRDVATSLLEQSAALYRGLGHHSAALKSLLFLAEALWDSGDLDQARALCDVGLAESRKTKDMWGEFFSLLLLGWMAYDSGDDTTATRLYKESLAVRMAAGVRAEISFALNSLAVCAVAQGEVERAIVLMGADAAAGVWKVPANSGHLPRFYEARSVPAATRAELGESTYDALFARGQAMTLEQAAAYALE